MSCLAKSCFNVEWKRRPFCEEHWKGLRNRLQRRIHKAYADRDEERYRVAVTEARESIDLQ